jgi:predicted aminopeptidase
LPLCSGCQIGYYLHSGYYQSKLINSRKPIAKVLKSDKLDEKQKAKLRLVGEVKAFGESTLGLAKSRNYTTYIQLDEPHVTYIVQVAYAHELKSYLWKFPFVGEVPYKGYFRRKLAEEEAGGFDKTKYDTSVRGVSAYSTLGWFQDSVLSSMLRYEDIDLAELILHESIHTTLYIKSAAEFNERLATFMGHEGMKLFFKARDGADSPNLKAAELDTHDQKLFSAFITQELKDLKKWYEDNKGKVNTENKTARIKEIQARYTKDLKPKMKTRNYDDFATRELNNAVLLAYQTYEYSLEDFEKLYAHFGRDFAKTLEWLKSLKDEKDPAQKLKDFVAGRP